MNKFPFLKIAFIGLGSVLLCLPTEMVGQTEESVYFQRNVVDKDGESLPSDRSIEEISFTAFLNAELDSVLIENAPRWDDSGSNWNAVSSVVGVELQNFYHFHAGDTARIRFTDLVLGQQDTYSQPIDSIPWNDPSPFDKIQLNEMDIPEQPRNVSVNLNSNYERTLTWEAEPDLEYWIYRKNRTDVIFNGNKRNLYTLQAKGISNGEWTDPNTNSQRKFAYIIFAMNDQGNFSPHSREVSQDKPESKSSVYFKKFVSNANGERIEKSNPDITFTAFLNSEQDSILLENAPRFHDSNPENIDPVNGIVGVELQLFPHFEAQDTAFIRVTDKVLDEQGTLNQPIDTIPWNDPNPFKELTLIEKNLPAVPENAELSVDKNFQRTITWEAKEDLSYRIYRRNRNDTLANGIQRNLYTLQAKGLTSGRWTDSNSSSDAAFGYVIFAEDGDGTLSSHSPELVRSNSVSGLKVPSKTSQNVSLRWDRFEPVVNPTRVAGYNVYRRKEDGSFGSPETYTGPDPEFTDSRLDPGQTYYYRVFPRNMQREEFGNPQTIQVTTKTGGNYTSYTNLKTAVVIYKNTNHRNGGDYEMPDATIPDIKKLLDYAREFYWRNTKMQLNFEFDYIIVDDYKVMSNNSAQSTRETGNHLAEDYGVVNTQYDFVFRIAAPTSGYWSWGATNLLGLPGPERRTGFSHLQWPLGGFDGGFDAYPAEFPDINVISQLIWLYVHEGQHAIDGIYNQNGHPEMGHGDFPWLYGNPELKSADLSQIPGYPTGNYPPNYPEGWGVRFGKRFDFQATMMRDFKAYKDLSPEWGEIIQARDQDQDGIPDHDERVPIDEKSFGSDPTQADTDGDGYPDKKEAIDGIYHYSYSDPLKKDTDQDGLEDGNDPNPRYPMKLSIKQKGDNFSPRIDGTINEWPDITMVNDTITISTNNTHFSPKLHMAYDADSLYVAIRMPKSARPTIKWDFGADGRYYGSGNTHMVIDVANEMFSTLRTWDASDEVQQWIENNLGRQSGNGMWDHSSNYQSAFGSPIFTTEDINLKTKSYGSDGYDIEMSIPKNENAGLMLESGQDIGLMVNYNQIGSSRANATTFDKRSYEYVTLCDCKTTDIEQSREKQAAHSFELQQNYPNPFNPVTTIDYSIPKKQHVTLKVYNLVGRVVTTLVNQKQNSGQHSVTFNAQNLSSGMYYYRIKSGNKEKVKKMMLIK